MRFTAEYTVPETDNKGILSNDEYLLVDSVGYYEYDEKSSIMASMLVGFDDQLYFSRLFKKYKGQSPKDFMQLIKCTNK